MYLCTRVVGAFATVIASAAFVGCLSNESHPMAAEKENPPVVEPVATPAPAPPAVAVNTAPATKPAAAVTPVVMSCDNSRLYYPTGEQETSMLLLERKAQAQPRVGKPYNYQIIVTNLTNTPLRGVTVQEMLPTSFAVGGETTAAKTDAAAGAALAAAITDTPKDDASQAGASDMPKPAPDMSKTMAMGKDSAMAQHTHVIGELGPKESRTIDLNGVPSQAGPMNTCTMVTCSPTLCTACTVINPQLRISKQSLGSGDLCQVQTIRYTVTNTGTGDVSGVRIDDQLADGLMMESGAPGRVSLNIGTLTQGQSRTADVKVKANAAGTFSSTATATADQDITAKSEALAMAIKAPQLAVAIKAPEKEYLGEPLKYEVTVKNVGNAIARSPSVRLDTGGDVAAAQPAAGSAQLAGAVAQPEGYGHAAQPAAGSAGQEVGELAPGASKTITIPYTPRTEGDVHVSAIATDPCAKLPASAAGLTHVTALPALQLSAVDSHDPIRVGENVTYTINVLNQGFGNDKDISVVVTIPDAEQYVSSTGASEGKLDGNKFTFAARGHDHAQANSYLDDDRQSHQGS